MFISLTDRDFRFLWLGMIFLFGGMQMEMLAAGYLTYDITSSPFLLSVVEVGFALPMLSLALFGGALADRVERKRLIQISQAGALLVALFIALSIVTDTITWVHLFVASMLEGAIFSFMMPARQAIIPQLVGQDRVGNAMALQAAGMSATALMAPAVAGVLYAFLGPDIVYFVIAGMESTALVLTSFVPKVDTPSKESSGPMLRDIKAGLFYIRQRPLVMVLLVMGLASAFLVFPFRIMLPVFVVDLYHRGPESMGLLVALMGGGSLVGALFIASLGKKRRGLILVSSSLLSGIALLLVALVPLYLAAIGLMVMLGLGDAGRRALNQALIMEEAEDQYRGRVMSVFMMNWGLMPLAVLPTGIVAELLGAQVAIGVLAGLLLTTSLAILLTQKRLRDLP